MLPTELHDLASGKRRGLRAALFRSALRLAASAYGLAVRLRNRRFDLGRGVERVAVPVVSVGNLTTGGTGKTPMVEWIARWFRGHGVRVTIVSRGYGAQAGARNDEALELEARLNDVPHLQNPRRVEAARLAIEEFESQLILLDDGFQHRRLARDLDVAMIDALEPFGLGYLLPRGFLREPLSGLRRAHVVALSRADLLSPTERERIREQVRRHAPAALWLETAHAPRRLIDASGAEAPVQSLAGKRVAAFCGIGNPIGFRRTLAGCGAEVCAFREFPDHHAYRRSDLDALGPWAVERSADVLVCTHKDLVKIGLDRLADRPLWAVAIELQILQGQADFEARLRMLLPPSEDA